MAEEFSWPVFDHQPLDADRTWSAMNDSYDQRSDDVYYAIWLFQDGAQVAAFTVRIGMDVAPHYDNWTTPDFVPAFRAELAKHAAAGVTNTSHVARALR